MSLRRKITLLPVVILSIFTFIVIAMVALSFRELGIESAKDKSKLTAEFVRDSLTAHMVNGIMDKRGYFLEKITNSQNVKDLWLVRSKSVEEQFGKSTILNEGAKDGIDLDVLKSGVAFNILDESSQSVTLRVTIPYIASSEGLPNCLECHNAKDGEVLGAISMVFDVSDVRESGLHTIVKIILISIALLLVALLISNILMKPYMILYEGLIGSIHAIKEGDYSKKVKTKLKDEAGEVAVWLNSLNEMLKDTVDDIDKKISILLNYSEKVYNKNPLIRTKEIIWELADIYKFKKTIEVLDEREKMYESLYFLVKNRFDLEEFALVEIDSKNNTKELLFPKESEFWLYIDIESKRLDDAKVLFVDEDENRALLVCNNEQKFIDIKYHVSQNFTLLLSILVKDHIVLQKIKDHIPLIFNYLDALKPVAQNNIYTEMLKESSLRDSLTGLYNRKFLDEYIESVTSISLRSKTVYGILMVDIDYFKAVNDTYGHDVGDVVINSLAKSLKECTRESDLSIRFGGEEFVVLLYNPDVEVINDIAEKIRIHFSKKKFSAGRDEISKTISIGIALFPQDASTIWKGIKFADIALYKAKESGRDRVVRFKKQMIGDAMV